MMRTTIPVWLAGMLVVSTCPAHPDGETAQAFEDAYTAWQEYIAGVMMHSDDAAYTDNAPFKRIIELGPRGAPDHREAAWGA